MHALILAFAIVAGSANKPCPPIPKVHPPGFKCKPGLVLTQCDGKPRCLPPGGCPEKPAPKVVVPPPVVVPPALPPAPAPRAAPSAWRFAVLGEVGPTLCGPEFRALLGLRVRHVRARLGLQAYTLFNRGQGLEALVYPVQGPHFRIHLSGGVLVQGSGHPSVVGVPRTWDWTVGSGVDIPITKYVAVVADWKWYRPFSTPAGFGATDVTTNSLRGSMLLAGLAVELP